jgi:hypothetical protein
VSLVPLCSYFVGRAPSSPLLGPSFGATLLFAVGVARAWLLFLLALGLGLGYSEVVRGCLLGGRLGLPEWVCLEPVSCGCVLCGLRLFVFDLGSLPFRAHAAVKRVSRPSLSHFIGRATC